MVIDRRWEDMTVNSDNERKRAYLMRYLYAKQHKNECDEELTQLCTVSARAIEYTDMPRGSATPHGLETIAEAAERQLDELRKATRNCTKIRDEVRGVIKQLPETESCVMFYRYTCYKQTAYERKNRLEGTVQMTWKEIAERMHYSEQNVWRIHGLALAHLVIPDSYKN